MKKYLSKLFILTGLLLVPLTLLAIDINFDPALDLEFPGYTGNQSNIHFMYGGNDFEGVVFPLMGTALSSGVDISVGTELVTGCMSQVEGLYYNNSRGLLVWPLDLTTLSGLKNIDAGYDGMVLTGGLYYNCYGKNSNEVYGQVLTTLFSVEYKLAGGLNLDFGNNTYFNNFTGTLIYSGNILSGFIFDNNGGIGKVYEPIVISLNGDISFIIGPDLIEISNEFYTNKTGVDLQIISSKSATYTITGDSIVNITGITDGNDMVTVELMGVDGLKTLNTRFDVISKGQTYGDIDTIILDTTRPTEPNLLLPVNGSFVDDLVNFSWGVSVDTGAGIGSYKIVIRSGSNIVIDQDIGLNTTFNAPVYPEGTIGNVLISGYTYTWYINVFDNMDQGYKNYGTTRSFTAGYTSTIDYIPPSMPIAEHPNLFDGTINTDVTFEWTASIDNIGGAGLDNYEFRVYNGGTTIVSGFTNNTTITFPNSLFLTGTYNRWVRARDLSGNISSYTTETFATVPTPDLIPDSFSFDNIDDAKRSKLYKSDEITISGLSTGVEVLAEINRGVLFIDGELVGLTGMVSNGSGVYIELIASDDYNTTRSSRLTIETKSTTFYIDTERRDYDNDDDDDNYSSDFLEDLFAHSPKLEVIRMFNELVEMYEDESLDKQKQFFHAFWVNLKDEITVLKYKIRNESNNDDKRELQKELYVVDTLHDLVFGYLMHELGYAHEVLTLDLDKNGKYTTQNGKTYYIKVRKSDGALYSTTFKTTRYFPTRSSMKAYIDINNPIKAHASSGYINPIVTPSGKVYGVVYDSTTMTFYSPDSKTQKRFEELGELHVRLDINNPGDGYWNHTVDPTYTTVMYQAPNGKYYALKKTTDNRYFSSFFTSAKYFASEALLIEHIDAHNSL